MILAAAAGSGDLVLPELGPEFRMFIGAVLLVFIAFLVTIPVALRRSSQEQAKVAYHSGYLYGLFGKSGDLPDTAWSAAELKSWNEGQVAGSDDSSPADRRKPVDEHAQSRA